MQSKCNKFVCSLLALTSLSAWAKQYDDKPNVIIIYADDLGYGDLGCYGAIGVKTPHIDSLAKRGIRFTNAYAMAATSTPSRYGLLTGEYAWRRKGTDVAAGDAAMIIKPNQYTMADLFKSVGYRTAAIGKWHLGLGAETGKQDWNRRISPGLRDLGFDYSYIMAATADRVPCIFLEQDSIANKDTSSPIEVNYHKPFAGEPLAQSHAELLQLPSSHGHDMAIVNAIGRIGYSRGGGTALWQDENIADSITRKALDFIESSGGEPFFLYYATNDIHVPRFPNKRFRGTSKMGLRGDAIVQFDWCVGEIVKQLERLGILNKTLIVLTSDNGAILDDGYDDKAEELLGEHDPSGGLRAYKYSAFEGGTRVPMIVSWGDGIKSRGDKNELFSQVDLMASFAQMLGVDLPRTAAPDSRQLAQPLLGVNRAKSAPWIIQQAANKTLSIRVGRWKYIEPSDGPKMIPWGAKVETGYNPKPQLYDLKNDPRETTNLAKRKPKVLRRLMSLLAKVRAK